MVVEPDLVGVDLEQGVVVPELSMIMDAHVFQLSYEQLCLVLREHTQAG